MTPLCSFLIPSRFRFDKLKKLIESIITASQPDSFEIVVRLHDDDTQSLKGSAELREYPNTRFIVGATYKGYESLNLFTAELIEEAKGEWAWLWNDDMEMLGHGWEDKLRPIHKTSIVQPEIHQLNASIYPNDSAGPCPCVAREQWVADYLRQTNSPAVDINLAIEYRRRGLPTVFLEGITAWHQWEGLDSHAT